MKPDINEDLIRKLERLAMISLAEDEREKLTADIRRILDFMQSLDEVDVEGIEEMVSPVSRPMETREEIPEHFFDTESIIKMFPDISKRYLRLPPIKGDE
ncbi:MAG TPA: Asp-tRNA(Asn)/Glu-tRNA(Gln) amidotransferase GatCAB subunit C [Kosmotogaceae bacterium]|nr:MAG: Aspartyl/glutamyl-tRNA(Asn/Gln) amidotransferase subunit C [Thermotogales bacterium 46_20]HAA85484.1 Asp-tRNA(Asn)/Glu-tRNA(Gln) amidotransferase GatCAB subunit C [Kosmotogaceae bacterium]